MGRRSEHTFFQRRYIDGQHAYEKMLDIPNQQGNANQNDNKLSSNNSRMATIQSQEITRVGDDVEKWEPSSTDGGNVNWSIYFGKPKEVP